MKKEQFISSIGYDGMAAVVDKRRYKENKVKTLKELLQEGDYRAAAAMAIYNNSEAEMEEVISAYNRESSSNYSKEVLSRLFGVAKVDVKKVSML